MGSRHDPGSAIVVGAIGHCGAGGAAEDEDEGVDVEGEEEVEGALDDADASTLCCFFAAIAVRRASSRLSTDLCGTACCVTGVGVSGGSDIQVWRPAPSRGHDEKGRNADFQALSPGPSVRVHNA